MAVGAPGSVLFSLSHPWPDAVALLGSDFMVGIWGAAVWVGPQTMPVNEWQVLGGGCGEPWCVTEQGRAPSKALPTWHFHSTTIFLGPEAFWGNKCFGKLVQHSTWWADQVQDQAAKRQCKPETPWPA